jgi:hypothetical protein
MSIVETIEVVWGDVRLVEADVLVMKYADDFYGADLAVADSLGYRAHIMPGGVDIVDVRSSTRARHGDESPISAKEVAFLGVGPLYDFRYEHIRDFGARSIDLIAERRPATRTVATTVQGVGYGLDAREAFLSHVQGIVSAANKHTGLAIDRYLFIELAERRAERLKEILRSKTDVFRRMEGTARSRSEGWPIARNRLLRTQIDFRVEPFGSKSETKPKLFVAMPFDAAHRDEYDIAFVEAAHDNGYVCERLDLEEFTGDVVAEIERRIRGANGLIALLNDLNPNVFLEIGYAMALHKPIIFVAREGAPVPFDIRNQKRVEYSRIAPLRDRMRKAIAALNGDRAP